MSIQKQTRQKNNFNPLKFLIIIFCLAYVNICFAANPSPKTKAPTTPAPWGQNAVITTYIELHVLTNWPTSSGTPSGNNTNCGNGMYVPNSMTAIGVSSTSMATYIYSCSITFTDYDLVYNTKWLAEKNAWVAVTPTNAPAGATDTATFKYQQGYPTTTYKIPGFFSTGPTSKLYGCNLVKATAQVVGTSTTFTAPQTGLNGPSMFQEGVANLTATVYPGEQIYITKTSSGSSYSNMTCAGYYTVQSADIGNSLFLDCCPTNNAASLGFGIGSGMTACPTCGWYSTNIVTSWNPGYAATYCSYSGVANC